MSKQLRTPSGIPYRWGIYDHDWEKYMKGQAVVRHAWMTLDRKKDEYETVCGAILMAGGRVINRNNIPKCEGCTKILLPELPHVTSYVVTEAGHSATVQTYQVYTVWSNGHTEERFVIKHRGYPLEDWDTTKPYPQNAYACTCGGERGPGESKTGCEHIHRTIEHLGYLAQASLRGE